MGKKDKLVARLKTRPKDFTFAEAETLLGYFSYHRSDKGRTSGLRVMFVNDDTSSHILLHKPHPRKELIGYQIQQLMDQLVEEGLI